MGDCHPDAHACRAKLSLAVMYSGNTCKWGQDLHEEMDAYLHKLEHVRASCRLTVEEVSFLTVFIPVYLRCTTVPALYHVSDT